PGVKYDVRLRFGPCRQDVNPTPFSVSNGNPKTFNMPATSFGFVFDIYFLDNSFNMTINGKEIATQEIQFQKNVLFQPQQNVEFADGTGTYEAGYPGIWQFDGNAINGNSTAVPIIRVVISPDGTVSMYGAKQNRGPLYPLRLTNGNTFQKITWNTTSSNTVTATQLRDSFGGTTMNGMGYGKQIIDCINK
ncbi:TPA: hypothetical protein JRX79_003463, partial [Elizabethkingia meningoseptica]|nr:hypothetical protein [Elizabethkingia meningoseptica]